MSKSLRALALGLSLIVAGPNPYLAATAQAEPACWPEWSEAAAVVERERLTSAKGVNSLARQHIGGDLVRITLCTQDGAYVYRLLVRNAQGHVATVTVDARRPFDR
jgi:uncharacterized membrane protein YkoI